MCIDKKREEKARKGRLFGCFVAENVATGTQTAVLVGQREMYDIERNGRLP